MFAPTRDQGHAGMEEERDIRAACSGKGLKKLHGFVRDRATVQMCHRKQRGGGIARSPSQTGTGRDALADNYLCAASVIRESLGVESGGPKNDVLFGILGHRGVAFDGQFVGACHRYGVTQVDGNKDGFDVVETIAASTKYPQAEVDFAVGCNCKRRNVHVGTNIVHK